MKVILILILAVTSGVAGTVELIHYPRDTNPDFHGRPRLVVEDPEAHGGTAQVAVPGKSQPGGTLCSFYSYARPAGRYRITWRVKVDDNTIHETVFEASTAKGSIHLMGTDFQKPNAYQEFSYTAEKGEGGFFAVASTWPGKGKVYVDRVTVVSEKLYTEKELIEPEGGLDLPDAWFFPAPLPPRVHMAKGLWWDFFGLSQAMAEMGGAFLSSSYHGQGQGGTLLRHFPASPRELMALNLVILANVDASALRPRGRLLLEEYVRNGGALLVLGGPFAFENGGYRFTALERLLPCRILDKGRQKAEGGLILKPADGAEKILPPGLAWGMSPRVFYYHPLEAQPDAQVLVTAGEHPLVMVGEVGKGRCGVIGASPEGIPGPDEISFWEWGDMPRLVGAVCQWLVSTPREKRAVVIDAKTRKELEKLSVPSPDENEEQRQQALTVLFSKCQDKTFAQEMLSTINHSESAPDRPFVDAAFTAIQPFVDTEFQEEAEALIESAGTGKAELGLRLLGLCRPDDAGETLKRFLEEGAGAFSGRKGEDTLGDAAGLSVDSGLEIAANERLKLSAVLALGDLGDPRYLGALRKATIEFSKKRQELTDVDEVADLGENIYQQSLATRCRLGDADAVRPFLQAILRNIEEIEEFQNAFDNMLPNKDDKRLMNMLKVGQIRLPILHRRVALCMEMMTRSSYSLVGRWAEELSRLDHPALTPFALGALAANPERNLTNEGSAPILSLLRECKFPELRCLAYRLASGLNDPGINAELASIIAQLAADSDPASVRFALGMVTRLKPEERERVLAHALKHPDPDVRRLATLSLSAR